MKTHNKFERAPRILRKCIFKVLRPGLVLGIFTLGLCLSQLSWGSSQPYIASHGINFSSGNKNIREHDVTIAGPTTSLSFTRNYNSQSVVKGPLGFGWTSSYSENLRIEEGVLDGLDLVVYSGSDGKMVYFYRGEEGTWVNSVGRKAILTEMDNDLGFQLNKPDGTELLFDIKGRLVQKLDRNGNGISLSYSDDLLASVTDGFGRTISFHHGPEGKLTSIMTPVGTFSYTYDEDNLIGVTKPDGTRRTYLYEDPYDKHNLTTIVDEVGDRVMSVEYDFMDRAVSSSKGEGGSGVSISYGKGYKRTITDSLGVSTTYQLEVWQGVAMVKSFTGPGCSSCGSETGSEYTYNARQQIVSMTDGRGYVTAFTYDDRGNKLSETKALGTPEEITTEYTYSDANRVETITTPSVSNPGETKTISMTYDDRGNLLNRTETGFDGSEPISRSLRYTYDSHGRLTSMDGSREDVDDITTYTYYPNDAEQGLNRGFLHKVINPLGHTITYSDYNGFGQAETITNANGLTTSLTYNIHGQVESKTLGDQTTLYTYDETGRMLSITLPGSRTISYDYTPAGQLAVLKDNLGNSIEYTYDPEGNKIGQEIFDPEGELTTHIDYEYDDFGRLQSSLYPDGGVEHFTYDEVGNVAGKTDQMNNLTSYSHDPLNRASEIIDPIGGITSFGYDLHGNQTSVTDAEGNTTIYEYDDFGNRIRRISPDTGVTDYTYDTTGNLVKKTDANDITTRYAYDVLNRLTDIDYPDSSLKISLSYDQGVNAVGRLSSTTDATGSTVLGYDLIGNLVRVERTMNGKVFTTAYAYNQNQELMEITYPSGRVVSYERDGVGNIVQISSIHNGKETVIADSINRLPFGPITDMSLGNGISLENSFDLQYRLVNAAAGEVYDKGYRYLPNSQIEAIVDNLDESRTQSFQYDSTGRLVGATGIYGAISYSYDKVGNRISRTRDTLAETYSYQPGSNRLDQVSGDEVVEFSYDAAGNTVAEDHMSFIWSDSNRLAEISINADTVGSYGYDSRGLRTVRTSAEGTTYSLYDQSGNLIAETDEHGTTIREYVYLEGIRLTQFDYSAPPEFGVNVRTSDSTALQKVKVYAFNANGAYTGMSVTTNEDGQGWFDRDQFGEGLYQFRIDYRGTRIWSEPVKVQTTASIDVVVEIEQVSIHVVMDGSSHQGVKVYAFTDSGSYLGLSGITDENGQVSFILPEGEAYTFRADLLGGKFWSDPATVSAGSLALVLNTGGGDLKTIIQEEDNVPLAGLKCYLFSESGRYLGKSAVSGDDGSVSFTVPDGNYKIRVDYLGARFWSDSIVISGDSVTRDLPIPHRDVTISVAAVMAASNAPLESIPCYLFNTSGAYLGIRGKTDVNGEMILHLPEVAFRVRADYFGQRFWSDDFIWQDKTIEIMHGTGLVEVNQVGRPLEGIKVYGFNTSGKYLGLNATTGSDGAVSFFLPDGHYRFRADYQGSQFWSPDVTLIPHQENLVEISTGGGSFVLTVSDQFENPLVDVPTYAFGEKGSYLGDWALTDGNGQVSYDFADGDYQIRIDYLDAQYWTPLFNIPADNEHDYVLDHREVTVTAEAEFEGASRPIVDNPVYLFTPEGAYLGQNIVTDAFGQGSFYLPIQEYRLRLDYLSEQYFSEPFAAESISMRVPEGQALVHLSSGATPLSNVPIYVFSDSDKYLGIKGTTDMDGDVLFQLPVGFYKFRADYQSNQFWANGEVTPDVVTEIDLQTGGGSLAVTVRTDESTIIQGVKCYLFSASGLYLGQSGVTDEFGVVRFDVADGAYQVRADYLGGRYWSDVLGVPGMLSSSILIEHRDINIVVEQDTGYEQLPLPGIRCYLFTESGSYTGLYETTDDNGKVTFSLPEYGYKVRADYLGSKYWTEPFSWQDSNISIPHGELGLTVYNAGTLIENAKVYLFSESGSYLKISGHTDSAGEIRFVLPESSYKLRVDFNGEQYWTESINLLPYQYNDYSIDLSNGLAESRVNDPTPERWDGEPPTYYPLLAINARSLTGMLPQITMQALVTDDPRAYWYVSDHLGTTQLITDDAGDVVWQGNYSPFGEVDIVIDRISNHFRFPGQQLDLESGLHYNWHRYYDAGMGRYVSADPIGLTGGTNLFTYVNGDPSNSIDFEGLKDCKVYILSRPLGFKALEYIPTPRVSHHHDLKLELSDGSSVVYGFFAVDFLGAAKPSIKIRAIRTSRIWVNIKLHQVDGKVERALTNHGEPIEQKEVCCADTDKLHDSLKDEAGIVKKNAYHIMKYNCQNWAREQFNSL